MRKRKDSKYNITFNDREYLVDLLSDYDITPEELAYQLTAYERGGIIDFKKGIIDVLSEKVDEPTYNDLTEFLSENSYEMVYPTDEFDDLESGLKPSEIASKTFYGDFNPGTAAYYKYNGYANYKGYEDIEDAIKDHPDFNDWYYAKQLEDLIDDEDFESDIVNGTEQLIKQGY